MAHPWDPEAGGSVGCAGPDGPVSDIFISYAREDEERIGRLVEALEKQGWSVFWDRQLLAGESFSKLLEREIGRARCVLVLWSSSALNSDWVAEEAAEGKGRLVPARLDRVKPPLGYRRLHTADLSDWDGASDAPGLGRLIDSIRNVLEAPSDRPRPPAAEGFEDSIVKQVAAGLAAADPLTWELFAVGLEPLFRRMTFREPTWRCPGESWGERLHAALQTWKLLDHESFRRFVRDAAAERYETYDALVLEVQRYGDYLVNYLFRGSSGLDPLRELAGDRKAFFQALPEPRIFDDPENSSDVRHADEPRTRVIDRLQELTAAVSRDIPPHSS